MMAMDVAGTLELLEYLSSGFSDTFHPHGKNAYRWFAWVGEPVVQAKGREIPLTEESVYVEVITPLTMEPLGERAEAVARLVGSAMTVGCPVGVGTVSWNGDTLRLSLHVPERFKANPRRAKLSYEPRLELRPDAEVFAAVWPEFVKPE